MMVDEGAQFSATFSDLAKLHDINVEKSGIQSHNSLGIGERYHKPQRDTYRKLKIHLPSMQHQFLLTMAVKAMNETLVPEGTVPYALIFGKIVPRLTLAERVKAALKARRYMSQHLEQTKVWRALKHSTPPATDRSYQPGDKVLVWHEKVIENCIEEWKGPYTIIIHDATSKIDKFRRMQRRRLNAITQFTSNHSYLLKKLQLNS